MRKLPKFALGSALVAAAAILTAATTSPPTHVISDEVATACGARFIEKAPLGERSILDRYIAKKKLTPAEEEKVRDECAAFDLGAVFVVKLLSQQSTNSGEGASMDSYDSGDKTL